MTSVSKTDLRIDWATHEAAKYACEHWHYSKQMPMPPLLNIGVWECNKFIGVVVFSRGASPYLFTKYGIKQTEGCELTRVALTQHKTPVSRIVKIAVMFLKKRNNLKLIVSFADPQYGHNGGIYQAGNWIYTGITNKKNEYWHKGKRYHDRQITNKGYAMQFGKMTKTLKPSDCIVKNLPGKHRYLMPLTKEMRQKIMPLSKPYPKRTPVEDRQKPSDDGGANPTRSLQSSSA